MARVVLIVDSATGTLIDVAGNVREGGRYRKFVKRMLSTDKNPVLDYGGNGGDKLTISKGGGRGSEINLKANTVKVDGELKVGEKTIAEIAASEAVGVLDVLRGTEGEVSVEEVYVTDSSSGTESRYIQISLDQSVLSKLEMIDAALGGITSLVKKDDIAGLAKDLTVADGDTIEEVKGTLRVLLERINDLSGSSGSHSESS
jgi:hypothetical protein